jgi:hypothetical protein
MGGVRRISGYHAAAATIALLSRNLNATRMSPIFTA